MKKSFTFLLMLGASLATQAVQAPPANPNRLNQLRDLKKVDIKAGNSTVHAWIMNNDSKREEGMMFLKPGDVKENQGMIFVFAKVQPVIYSFWMHNCPAGLDIIYIDAHRKVLNIGVGKPYSDEPVKAAGDYSYVLEVVPGWSKRHGLKAGAKVGIPSSLVATE